MRTKRIAISVLMLLCYSGAMITFLACTGCMSCTQWASRIGTSRIEVTPLAVSRTATSNLVVEMEFVRRDASLTAIHHDLGKRYAFFNPKLVEGTIRNCILSRDDRDIAPMYVIRRMIPADNPEIVGRTPQWYLYPTNLTSLPGSVSLPSSLAPDPTSTKPFAKGFDRYSAALQQAIDNTSYTIPLQLFPYEALDNSPDTVEHALWGPPVRWVMYPITVVLDVITGPFQIYQWSQGFKHGG